MNQAAAKLFISQPSLSEAVKELEREIGIRIFGRTNRGILVTTEGNEFLGYARQVVEQYRLMQNGQLRAESYEIHKKMSDKSEQLLHLLLDLLSPVQYVTVLFQIPKYLVIE